MTLKHLQHLSDEELLRSTDRAMQDERSKTTVVLLHLIEVADRRLYARDHDSFFSFLTEEKGYAAGSAQRRIDGAALLREIPSLAAKLDQATLNLSTLSLARQFFRNETKFGKKYSTQDKVALLEQLEGKSVRAVTRLLLDLSSEPESLKPKRELCPLRNGKTELRLELDQESLAKFERLRDLMAHTVPDGDRVKVLERIMDVALEKLDPLKKAERAKAREEKKRARQTKQAASTDPAKLTSRISGAGTESKPRRGTDRSLKANESSSVGGSSKDGSHEEVFEGSDKKAAVHSIAYNIDPSTDEEPRTFGASVRHHAVFAARGGCDHLDSQGRRCGSRRGLELDHRLPYALGGPSDHQNARVLCRAHNLYHASRAFGPEVINKFNRSQI
jgi:hypothetical protein